MNILGIVIKSVSVTDWTKGEDIAGGEAVNSCAIALPFPLAGYSHSYFSHTPAKAAALIRVFL